LVVAEISIIPIGTGSPSVSRYVAAAVAEFEASGLECTLHPMGTTVEAETPEPIYAALTRAQQAVFDAGLERIYTVVKMDERRDAAGDRSAEDMVRSVRKG
jgi:uncharacterized protein (TIGR00106 family)